MYLLRIEEARCKNVIMVAWVMMICVVRMFHTHAKDCGDIVAISVGIEILAREAWARTPRSGAPRRWAWLDGASDAAAFFAVAVLQSGAGGGSAVKA
ncbi:hypothetical protein R69749_03615 [Paraburkholderia domus]|uniref:Uncharacterized protein n=1 Tax=Paraburkholderia domus TaxID=2793075 RepID=A0A9N8MVM7_9BURK|nr:hypothetical protein R75483_04279 [Paraburkholderia domus]CAE6809166.1 hypothetical protein R70006_05680 [Paraburkholderia domus]CAE6822772.1 hypothetical protein R69749_03615 [Paraburkholderia domus]CAE6880710.1 hypothetical protein R70211_02093 [Paraburkholderia domus]